MDRNLPITTYQCIRCETTVCVLCAPEIQNPEDEPEYKPMSKVGICNQCNNTAIAGCRVETDDESVVLEDMEASNDTGPVQFDTENEQSSTSAVFRALETTTNSSSKGTDIQVPDKRKQWTREQKLEFIDLYKKYKNKAKAAREFKARYKFEVKASTYNPWINQEHKLRNSKYKSKKAGAGRHAAFPDMEKKLFEEFQELRGKGVKVKEWWFRSRCKQLMAELHPGVEFKMSNHWFDRFKLRYDISLRRPTNAAQKQSETLRTSIQQFHRYLRRTATVKATELEGVQEGIVGPWELCDIANMDQTPLQFCFNTKGATYAERGEKSVWTRTTGEGHDKRQCTVQLTIFADGEPRIKPLLIFKGTGQRIPDREKRQYDPRVVVKFQENAWCNEEMMVFWLRNMWKKPNMFGQPRDRLLIYDAHRAQTTERVKTILTQECKTTLGLVPPGATSKVQPLDVTFNAEFKKSVDRLATEHLSTNPEQFMTGKVTAGDRRVLFTKWVGTAWQETSRRLKDTVIRSFVKCGISLPISGSRDSEINIDGLPDYRMGESADIEEIEFFSDSDEES